MTSQPIIQDTKPLKPFILWAGGKRKIAHKLIAHLPKKFNHYYEPFVGGGALLFNLQKEKSFIVDLNEELITSYKVIRNNLKPLMKSLDKHKENHNEDYFYKIRDDYKPRSDMGIASRFIYLNKTCFNGLYRVNKKGEFKTSSGKKLQEKLKIYEKENLELMSEYLKGVNICHASFEKIQPKKNDFVYFDPPYHKTFNAYTKDGFGDEGQKRLSEFVKKLSKRGVKIMISNSDTELIRELYKDFTIYVISAPRSLNWRSKKKVDELIIVNY